MLGALILDRFDRKKALAFAMLGLVIGTAAGGLATGLGSLLAARVIAGAFGGPASAVSMAIIADVIPAERRGRAMGAVMGAFSVASVLGVPAGLELARLGGWTLPFFAVAALGALVATVAVTMMPSFTAHMNAPRSKAASTLSLVSRPVVLLALLSVACVMMGQFAIIPNLSAYWQFNRGYPRASLGTLYLIGGLLTFVTMRVSGVLADRLGPTRVVAIGTFLYGLMLYFGFINELVPVPVMTLFVSFMVLGTFRMIPLQALTSRVPDNHERARYMSAGSAVQHMASALGAVLASRMLSARADGGLVGMDRVALFTLVLAAVVPFLSALVERKITERDRARTAAPALATAGAALAVASAVDSQSAE
jgi:predicted MFS family arabinose efflux permease